VERFYARAANSRQMVFRPCKANGQRQRFGAKQSLDKGETSLKYRRKRIVTLMKERVAWLEANSGSKEKTIDRAAVEVTTAALGAT
jgi:hypothetical protein